MKPACWRLVVFPGTGLFQYNDMSQLQNSGWMSSNPTLSSFLSWNEMHGGFMDRNYNSEMDQRGEADRRSRVLQLAHMTGGPLPTGSG